MKPVLYQRSRPSSLDGYVFVDNNMDKKFREWITKKEVPNLILSGSPGTGKCLDGSELVDVQIEVNSLNEHQHRRLMVFGLRSVGETTYRLPIKDLFEILDLDSIAYETPVASEVDVKIKSPNGDFVKVNQFVKKNHLVGTYVLSDGSKVTCSTKHIIFQSGVPTLISDASSVDTMTGSKEITESMIHEVRDVYDVALDAPHMYVTPNGIIHHNTTLCYILCNELGVPDDDILYIKATLSNGIQTIRDKIVPFVEVVSHGDVGRIVILDEGDQLSPSAQDGLRNIIEDSMEYARFFITGNYAHKFTDALKSRCQEFNINALDKPTFMLRVGDILVQEGIEFDMETLQHYTDANYPDMRGIFNDIERYTSDGVLRIIEDVSSVNDSPWLMESVSMIMDGKLREARDVICKNIKYEEYGEFYRLMYENMDWWAKGDPAKQDRVIMTIKEHLVADTQVGDREIVLSACLTKLSLIA